MSDRDRYLLDLVAKHEEYKPHDPAEATRSLRVHDIEWTIKGISLGRGISGLTLRWRDLHKIRCVDPCPDFMVSWRYVGGRSEKRFTCRFEKEEEAFAEKLEALFAHVAERRPHKVVRGWLEFPEVPWERAEALPADLSQIEGEGAYRSGRVKRRVVVAERAAPSLGSRFYHHVFTDIPWGHHPREVVVTDSEVYVRFFDGIRRLPRASLRAHARPKSGAIGYLFGRRTALYLPAEERCPVIDLFERDLETGAHLEEIEEGVDL